MGTAGGGKTAGGGVKVLVIDDDPMARDLYKAILEEAGFAVATAEDGASGIACYKAEPFDCVILDIYMPGMSGLDLIQELGDLPGPPVPIIAVSGGSHAAGADSLRLAETLGAAKSLTKEFEHGELVAAVRELTGG